ncbi:hypothetical protein ACFC1T_08935 [Kitasatospora sp. NPDC056076]|uniref:hypothetical protein n=1 Tax=Kitasatospora sp. NPDC056076 TaxID=3345703 RepID=UPI0035E28AE8
MRQTSVRTADSKERRPAGADVPAGLVPRDFPRVVTLGPRGTDASHAARYFHDVVYAESFPAAMDRAWRDGCAALICAGYIDISVEDGNVADCWVDLNFRWAGRMGLRYSWTEPTKPMALAVRPDRRGAPASVALHAATRSFAEIWLPGVERQYVPAKPLAVEMVVDGRADACIGSVDVIERAGLSIVQVVRPAMVWCLYAGREPQPQQPHPQQVLLAAVPAQSRSSARPAPRRGVRRGAR